MSGLAKKLLYCVGLVFLSSCAGRSSDDARLWDGGPNPLYGRSFPAEGKIGISEEMNSSGVLKNVVWIRDPKVFRKTLSALASGQRLTLTREINWDAPLYAVFVDGRNRIVFAGKSDQGRSVFYPAKAALKGASVRIESVNDGKRNGMLHQADSSDHNLYAGVMAKDLISKFEAVLAKTVEPK